MNSPWRQSHPMAHPIQYPKVWKHMPGLSTEFSWELFQNQGPARHLEGLVPFSYEQNENSAVLKYYAGVFYSLNGVTSAIGQVKKIGFPDAFIVAYLDGKLISTEKAKEVEFAGMKF